MKTAEKSFLGLDAEWTDPATARVGILPFPYAGGISYGEGTDLAPEKVIESSHYLELYDELLEYEPYRSGITTWAAPEIPEDPAAMIRTVSSSVSGVLEHGQFPIVIGGDHSISSGVHAALSRRHGAEVSVIQLDAHADLRDSYENSRLSHACVMSRIREKTENTLQLGIRSLSADEAERIENEHIPVGFLHQMRAGSFDWRDHVRKLPDPVFITFDVDALDWSVVRSTGTPEPGGLLWDETMEILQFIFSRKQVAGVDVVELSARPDDPNSPFAVAKLIYKMIGFLQHGTPARP